jgi:hypothetical protein
MQFDQNLLLWACIYGALKLADVLYLFIAIMSSSIQYEKLERAEYYKINQLEISLPLKIKKTVTMIC